MYIWWYTKYALKHVHALSINLSRLAHVRAMLLVAARVAAAGALDTELRVRWVRAVAATAYMRDIMCEMFGNH